MMRKKEDWHSEEKKSETVDNYPVNDRLRKDGGGVAETIKTINLSNKGDIGLSSSRVGEAFRAPKRPRVSLSRGFGLLLRTLICDLPLLSVFLAYAALLWLSHVHFHYLREQLQAMHFSDERRAQEITYYTRPCSDEDITARDGAELFLSKDATVDDAYQHQLKHGFTVFPSVLSEETAAALRNHVAERNTFNSSDSESIFVIENKKRYSFGLETSYPVVASAMMEIANHQLLRPALEKILGKNPALIEMTAITSSYGAVDQYWHDDVIPTASAIRYARTFGPSYSVFIQLQNTTKAMGATDACPGTHYCSAAGVDSVCEQYGFQMVGNQGYWHAGDALLMNMNSYHRGTAHTDPYAMDRVMLILTFTTRPRTRSESRQLSQGITFSLRWDEWGHTLDDMSRADKIMQWPWTVLRALGIFKLPGTDWGIDYITSGSMRMSNEDNGFREDEFEDFIERGGIWWVPAFLQGRVDDDDSWYEYYLDTGKRCLGFVEVKLLPVAVTAYIFLFAIMSLLPGRGLVTMKNAVLRLTLLGFISFSLLRMAIHGVDETDWARDIRHKKRHWGVFRNQVAFGVTSQGPTTLPHRRDVLIENRYGSGFLAMYEDFIGGHPGNRFFQKHVVAAANTFHSYQENLRNASAHYIFRAVQSNQGRFLHQGPTGDWEWLGDGDAVSYVRRYLTSQSHPAKQVLSRKIRHLVSYYMYGIHRETVMAQRHAVPYLRHLETKLMGYETSSPVVESSIADGSTCLALRSLLSRYALPNVSLRVIGVSKSPFPPTFEAQEPEYGAWLTVGDNVECLEDDEYWYPATVQRISAHGEYDILWATGTTGRSELGFVRPFDGYKIGQVLEVYDEGDDEQMECVVIRVHDNGTYDMRSTEDGSVYRRVRPSILRRPADDKDLDVATYKAAY